MLSCICNNLFTLTILATFFLLLLNLTWRIVNQLVNLAGFDYDEENKEPETASLRLNKALLSYREQMSAMLRIYQADDLERQALVWYAWIVMIAQWPVLCYFRYALGTDLKSEILSLLSLIAKLPEEQLAVI